MPDYSAELEQTLITGISGTGKTTLAFDILRRTPARCRFIYDPKYQAAHRLRLPVAKNPAALELQIKTNWVCFHPGAMFPPLPEDKDDGTLCGKRAFRFFLKWVYEVCRRGKGDKILFLDEIWEHVSPNSIPPELAKIVQEGRIEGIHLITATQRPHKLNEAIISQSTSVYGFRLIHPLALKSLSQNLDMDAEQFKQLPDGAYLHHDLKRHTVTRGKVF